MDPHDNSRALLTNIKIIKEMVSYFVDETDNTVGKLYISYPMIEALWDYDEQDLEGFRHRNVPLQVVVDKKYKQLVGDRGAPGNINKYSLEVFSALAGINVKKANYIVAAQWEKPSYTKYVEELGQEAIIEAEEDLLISEKMIGVLSGLPLFMVDYWGNTNGFFDSLF